MSYIFVGYSGIGKTTYCHSKNLSIDLESSHFFKSDGWELGYVSLAIHLQRAGYNVFVSAHDVVRKALRDLNVDYIIVAPTPELKDMWISRLQRRYELSQDKKDLRALDFIEKNFESSIAGLLDDARAIVWLDHSKPYINAHPSFKNGGEFYIGDIQ